MFHKRVEQGKSFEFSSSIHWLSITSLEVSVRSSSYPAPQCVCLQTKEILHPLAISTFCQQCGDPSEAGGWEARPQLGINSTAQCAHWPGDQLHCTNVKCTHCTVVHCNALYIGVERWGSQYMDEILFLASFTLHTHNVLSQYWYEFIIFNRFHIQQQ